MLAEQPDQRDQHRRGRAEPEPGGALERSSRSKPSVLSPAEPVYCRLDQVDAGRRRSTARPGREPRVIMPKSSESWRPAGPTAGSASRRRSGRWSRTGRAALGGGNGATSVPPRRTRCQRCSRPQSRGNHGPAPCPSSSSSSSPRIRTRTSLPGPDAIARDECAVTRRRRVTPKERMTLSQTGEGDRFSNSRRSPSAARGSRRAQSADSRAAASRTCRRRGAGGRGRPRPDAGSNLRYSNHSVRCSDRSACAQASIVVVVQSGVGNIAGSSRRPPCRASRT